MKRKFHPIGTALLCVTPVLAIEPPPDNAPPPPSVESRADGATPPPPAAPAPERENAAFLGLVSAEVPALLAGHLGLQSGEGVIVNALVPGGPAEVAGLALHDVILSVAGQPVDSPARLSERLAAHRPGDSVELDLVHQGEKIRKSVTLGSRPADPWVPDAGDADPFKHLGNFSPSQLNRLRGIIGRNFQGSEHLRDMQLREMMSGGIHSQFDQTIREMQERMAELQAHPFDELPPGGKIQFKSDSTFRLADEQGSIEIRSRDDDKEVTVRDENHDILWSGPWNNDEDKAAAPADIRQRIEKLNLDENFKGNGFRFQFGPRSGR